MYRARLDQRWNKSFTISSICPSLYLSISFTCSIVLAWWVDIDMHYSSACPFCHCWAELGAEWCAKQDHNQSTCLWHPTQWDMLIGCHRISMQIEKCWGSILYTLRLSGALFTPAIVEVHWYSAAQPMKYSNHLFQKRPNCSPQQWHGSECGYFMRYLRWSS